MPKPLPPGSPVGPFLLPGAIGLLSLAGALAAIARPPASGPVAMVFPPWWSAAQIVIAAAGAGPVIRLGGLPFVVIAAPSTTKERAFLRRSGAVFLLDPIVVSGCFQVSDQDVR